MYFCPSLDFGECGDVADESEYDEGENAGEGMGLSLLGSGIADFFETSDEVDEGSDFEHIDLREGKKEAKPFRFSLQRLKKRECLSKYRYDFLL